MCQPSRVAQNATMSLFAIIIIAKRDIVASPF